MTTVLDTSPVWLLYPGTVLFVLAGNECGFRLGSWRRIRMPEGEKAPATAIMGATLGLLAFMLAFTFGMASSRFDARKQLLLDEASAILRAYARSQFLPEPQRTECSELLRHYVDLRIQPGEPLDWPEIEKLLAESEETQNGLWRQAASLSEKPSAVLAGFMASLGDLTDLQMKRVRAAVWNRIPATILGTLYLVAFLALMGMGYGAGLAASRTIIPSVLLALTFSAIIVLIVDLERPGQQLFHVSQEPMMDVARRIHLTEPVSP